MRKPEQLYQLLFGRSKQRMKPIMIDTEKKCKNYRDARQNVTGWHDIQLAPPGSTVWRQKSATIGGNKPDGQGRNGYVGKNGFNAHT